MAVTKTASITVRNAGSRRVILGPPPKSKGGGSLIAFDTEADAAVPAGKRLGQVHTIEGERAEQLRGSKVFAAVKDRLQLQVA